MTYLENRIKTAEYLEEDIDRITLEPLLLSNHHSSVPLETNGRIQYWDTTAIYTALQSQKPSELYHPITKRKLNIYEINYINHYYKCLEKLKNNGNESEINIQDILNDFKNEKNIDLARAVLTPYDFPIFKKYISDIESDRFERKFAEDELENSEIGTWGLRYSSFNRCSHSIKNRLGLHFYAISFKKETINHILILHRPGWGWTQITGIKYMDGDIYPHLEDGSMPRYHACFVDILKYITQAFNLQF